MEEQEKNNLTAFLPLTLVVLVVIAACVTLIPTALKKGQTNKILRQQAGIILAEAKKTTDSGDWPVTAQDAWGQTLRAKVEKHELSNYVWVFSSGPDKEFETKDDMEYMQKDIHVRKSLLKGVEASAESAAKGFIKGVKESFRKEGED